jgi:predicted outer membrane repeat protein
MISKRFPRGLYAPEALESRIAPATFIVTTLADSGAGSLRQAVLDANLALTADTIVFRGVAAAGGEIPLTTGEIAITDSVKIIGPGAGKVIIDAGDLSRIFNIDAGAAPLKTVSISGLSMVEGNAGAGAGGAIFSAETLVLSNVVVSGSRTSGEGGGISVDTEGKFILKASIVSGNSSTFQGGGIEVDANAGIQIIGSTIFGNSGGIGGGIDAEIDSGGTGDILIEKTSIVGNTGTGEGGGATLDNDRTVNGKVVGKVTIRSSLISGNSSAAEGGGLYLDDGVNLIDRTTISNNTANFRGGGVGTDFIESLTVKNSKIINNRTTDGSGSGGGGILIEGGSTFTKIATILSSVIYGNVSASDGGGIFSDNAPLVIKSSTLTGNVASDDGGGLFARNGDSVIVSSAVFTDNRAGNSGTTSLGGGIAITDSVVLTVASSLFSGNKSTEHGGAIHADGSGAITFKSTRFIGNSTGGNGGAFFLSTSGVTALSSVTVIQNFAGAAGGGADFGGTGAKNVFGSLFRDNIATGGGGGIQHSAGILTLNRTTSVMYNAAFVEAGGIHNLFGIAANLVLNGSKVVSNTAPVDPQIQGGFTP